MLQKTMAPIDMLGCLRANLMYYSKSLNISVWARHSYRFGGGGILGMKVHGGACRAIDSLRSTRLVVLYVSDLIDCEDCSHAI
jgi:hypothetical protein